MKKIRLSLHAKLQCKERGTNLEEIKIAIEKGFSKKVRKERYLYRYNFSYKKKWQGNYYAVKKVAPVIV